MSLETSGRRPVKKAEFDWLSPLLAFLAAAGVIAVLGSLLMLLIWLLRGDSASSATSDRSSAGTPSVSLPAVNPPTVVAEVAKGTSPASTDSSPATASLGTASAATASSDPARSSAATSPASTPLPGASPAKSAGSPPANSNADRSPVHPTASPDAPQTFDVAKFRVTELSADAKSYALDPKLGRLAIVGPWLDDIGFVSAEELSQGAKETAMKKVFVGGPPTTVAYAARGDGGVFVVGTSEPQAVTVIDASSLKPLSKIVISEGYPKIIATTMRPGQRYVYLSLEVVTNPPYRNPAGVARLDLETFTIDVSPKHLLRELAVSADGEYLYTLPNSSSTEPTRLPAKFLNDPRPLEVLQRLGRRRARDRELQANRRYYVDPRGLFIVSGSNLFTCDLEHRLQDLAFDPQAFFVTQPWMAGLRGNDLVVGSINDGRIRATIPLPDDWLIADAERRRSPSTTENSKVDLKAFGQIFADEVRSRFVLGTQRQILVLPVDDLKLPQEKYLAIANPPPAQAVVGGNYECKFETVSTAPVTVELVSGPSGMKLDQQVVRWTPVDDQVGPQDVHVRLKGERASHDYKWHVVVNQGKITLPFVALGCCPSSDGRHAVVWGSDLPESRPPRQLNPRFNRLPGGRLAIVDLATQSVVSEKSLEFPVHTATFNKSGIYVVEFVAQGTRDKTVQLIQFAPANLGPLHKIDVSPGGVLNSIADQFLTWTWPGQFTQRLALPDLKPIQPLRRPYDNFRGASSAERLADGWLIDGTLWDEAMAKPKLLVEPAGFEVPLPEVVTRGLDGVNPALRGFVLDGPARHIPHISPWSPHAGVLSPDVPAVLSVNSNSGKVQLELAHLMSGEVFRRIQLRSSVDYHSYPYEPSEHGPGTLVTTKEHILVTHMGELFVIPNPGIGGAIPVPFRIQPQQSELMLSATKPTIVKYVAPGATKFELQFVLPDNESESLTSEEGVFEIDVPELLASIRGNLRSRLSNGNSEFGNSPEARLANYLEKARPEYTRLTGKKCNGAPTMLHVKVQAYGQDLSVVTLDHAYLIDVPDVRP